MIPNLIIPGAAKSGTSSLHEYLNQHPEIQMSKYKEPHLYSIDENYIKRFDKDFKSSIVNIFNKEEKVKYYGESSTSYLPSSDVSAERLFKDNPDVKFIILLRNPIERIESHYNWLKSNGSINKPIFEEVVDDYKNKYNCNIKIKAKGNYKSYIHHSLYFKTISNFLKYFDKKNFLIITTEELKEDFQKTINKCFDFLEIRRVNVTSFKKNKTEYIVKGTGFKHRIMPIYAKLPPFIKEIIPSKIKTMDIIDTRKHFKKEFFSEIEKNEILNFLKDDLLSLRQKFDTKFDL